MRATRTYAAIAHCFRDRPNRGKRNKKMVAEIIDVPDPTTVQAVYSTRDGRTVKLYRFVMTVPIVRAESR